MPRQKPLYNRVLVPFGALAMEKVSLRWQGLPSAPCIRLAFIQEKKAVMAVHEWASSVALPFVKWPAADPGQQQHEFLVMLLYELALYALRRVQRRGDFA